MFFNKKDDSKKDDNISHVRPKLIQYEFPNNKILVHKEGGYPVLHDSQLIVGPSQTVLMVRNGQIYKRFEAGAQVLETGVLLSTLKMYDKTFEGGENGVPIDFYFINKLFSDPLPWGTPSPIQLNDPQLGLYIRVAANGTLRYQITDPELYIRNNLNSNVEDLNRNAKQKVLAHFIPEIQSFVQKEKLGYFELSAKTLEISERLRDIINAKVTGMEGFKIVDFIVSAFIAEDDDIEILKVEQRKRREADTRAYTRNVEGYTYQEEQTYGAMRAAAANEGQMGGMMGTAMGASIGFGMGGMMAGQFNQQMQNTLGGNQGAANNAQPAPMAQKLATAVCGNCSAEIPEGCKFCPQCGTPVNVAPQGKFCMNCGTQLAPDAKFCPNCGKPQQ